MNKLTYLRTSCGLSFRELEKEVHIDKASLNLIEKGKVKLTETRIETFCSFYKVTSDFLLGKSDFGIQLSLSNGFVTINKQDYETYKNNNLLKEYIFNGEIVRVATQELENSIDPLFNQDIKEEINLELNKLNKKQLEKVLTFIKEIL